MPRDLLLHRVRRNGSSINILGKFSRILRFLSQNGFYAAVLIAQRECNNPNYSTAMHDCHPDLGIHVILQGLHGFAHGFILSVRCNCAPAPFVTPTHACDHIRVPVVVCSEARRITLFVLVSRTIFNTERRIPDIALNALLSTSSCQDDSPFKFHRKGSTGPSARVSRTWPFDVVALSRCNCWYAGTGLRLREALPDFVHRKCDKFRDMNTILDSRPMRCQVSLPARIRCSRLGAIATCHADRPWDPCAIGGRVPDDKEARLFRETLSCRYASHKREQYQHNRAIRVNNALLLRTCMPQQWTTFVGVNTCISAHAQILCECVCCLQ